MTKFNPTKRWQSLLSRPMLPASSLLAAAALVGCSADVGDAAPTQKIGDQLYLAATTTWSGGNVPVCYDSAKPGTQAQRDEALRTLNSSWGRATNLNFPGQSAASWGPCNFLPDIQGDYSAIAVHFCSATSPNDMYCKTGDFDPPPPPPAPVVPQRRAGAFRGVSLAFGQVPFQIASQSPNGIITFTPGFTHVSLIADESNVLQSRFRYQVIHEFGHALGFLHEQDRPDNVDLSTATGKICSENVNHEQGATTQTAFFDNDSIMNYCAHDPLDPFGVQTPRTYLSGGDILGARNVYSRRPTSHGFMILSDTASNLAVNAWLGARAGGPVMLHNACTVTNPDCTWTYERGRLISDRDPTLAIQYQGDKQGLVLASTAVYGSGGVRTCKDNPASCQWSYAGGQWISAAANAGMNALNGARFGGTVAVHSACKPTTPDKVVNTDCTWTLPNVMLTNHHDSTLAIRPTGNPVDGSFTQLTNACDPQNTNCTWTFSHGLIKNTADTTLALNAWGGTAEGANVRTVRICTTPGGTANPDCTWSWMPWGLRSDHQVGGTWFDIAAKPNPVDGTNLVTSSETTGACTGTGINCSFLGRFARN